MAGLHAAVQHANHDPMKALAIVARTHALARILTQEGARGWTLANRAADGGLFAQEAVFAAAAVHPVVQDEEGWAFDRESFLDHVLALAAPEGRA